jgi:hypothetical protein
MWDLCNQFVVVALTGGLLTLIFYGMIFIRSFGAIGTARKLVSGDRSQEWLFWCLGSSLFANVVAHFGINYMAQLMLGFFPLLACISVAAFEAKQENALDEEISSHVQFMRVTSDAAIHMPLNQPSRTADRSCFEV